MPSTQPVSILKQSRHDSKINHQEEEGEESDHEVDHDPRRRSQLLMASKRLSFRTNDTQLLEKMLRGDLSVGDERSREHHHVFDDDDSDDDRNGNSEVSDSKQDIEPEPVKKLPQAIDTKEWPSQSMKSGNRIPKVKDVKDKTDKQIKEPQLGSDQSEIPCLYPNSKQAADRTMNVPEVSSSVFTAMSLLFGIAATLQITDDWTLPITLAFLASRFLWTGSVHDMQFKIKLP